MMAWRICCSTGTSRAAALSIAWFAARVERSAREAREAMKGGGAAGLAGYAGHIDQVDAGEATGKVLIRGELWDFAADAKVAVGDVVEVIRIDGLKAFVKRKER